MAAIGLLLIRDTDHIHLAAKPEHIAGHGQRGAPLARPRFRRQCLDTFLLGVKGLGHGRVRLMRTNRTDALVFVVDMGRCPERLLQAASPKKGSRSPEFIDIADRLRDLNILLLADILSEERCWRKGSEVLGRDRLFGFRVERRHQGHGHIGVDVIPRRGHLAFFQQIFDLVAHALNPRAGSLRLSHVADRPAGG